MEVIDKFAAYKLLSEIRDDSNKNEVDSHIKNIFESGSASYDTIILINKYKPIQQLSIYNRIYENRRKNPLYKTLVNEALPIEERAIAISSLLTQILINDKKLRESGNHKDADLFISFMSASELSRALTDHFNGDSSKLDNVFFSIRETLKRLYGKKNNIQ